MADLFSPRPIGDLDLAYRILLAPMAPSRADARGVINPSARDYCGWRSDVGLAITRGRQCRTAVQRLRPGAGPVDR